MYVHALNQWAPGCLKAHFRKAQSANTLCAPDVPPPPCVRAKSRRMGRALAAHGKGHRRKEACQSGPISVLCGGRGRGSMKGTRRVRWRSRRSLFRFHPVLRSWGGGTDPGTAQGVKEKKEKTPVCPVEEENSRANKECSRNRAKSSRMGRALTGHGKGQRRSFERLSSRPGVNGALALTQAPLRASKGKRKGASASSGRRKIASGVFAQQRPTTTASCGSSAKSGPLNSGSRQPTLILPAAMAAAGGQRKMQPARLGGIERSIDQSTKI